MSNAQLGAEVLGAAIGLAVSPYLTRLTLTVPDRENARWWVGSSATITRYAVTAGVAVVLGALAGRVADWSALLPVWVVLAILCTPLVLIDVEHHRLPDRLVFAAAISSVVLLTLAAVIRSDWHELLRSLEGGAVIFAIFFALAMFAPFGLGDVKLGGVLAGCLGWFGWGYVIYGMVAGFVLASVVSVPMLLLRRASMKSAIPLGPALILGTFLVAAFDLVPSTLR
jgi:leader peptidase (prepilin peptidase)/N-methyltransferase